MSKIRLRILVDPFNDEESAYHCDMWFDEPNLQMIDKPHGMEDFIERFVVPGLWCLLDQFQQPYTDPEDLMAKTVNMGRDHLPRSIEFYRQKLEMSKAQRAA